MIKSIPLPNLVVSARNVRRANDPDADAQLAADIAAHGLLQNLVVTAQKTSRKGGKATYAVEAGGRRLRALQALQAEGVLPADYKVACLVLGARGDADAASEASLAENLQRLAMNPADECLAFQTLIAQGADVEGVARRFGLTVRHVEGRLRLAGLHPTVFDALGAGTITLDAAKAYAATSDQERQLRVFEQLGSAWAGAHPDSIRRMMVSATVPANDRRLRFVGEEAYVAAGGRLERDLFAAADEARVLDVALLEQLAIDKLEVEAAWLSNEHGYGFVRATLDGYVQSWRHEDIRRADIALPGPSEEDRAQIDALEAEIDGLVAVLEDEAAEDFAREEAEARIAELEAQQRAIASKPPELDPVTRGTVGFFLLLDDSGVPRLDRTPYALVADEAADEAGGADGGTGNASADHANTSASASGADASSGAATGTGAASPGRTEPSGKLPQRLVDGLAMQRRDILALHVARDAELAFDLAVFLMVKDEGSYCYGRAGSSLSARPPHDPVLRSALPAAPVDALLAQLDDGLDRSWTGHEELTAKFDAFRALPRAQREAWLGAAVARTLEASAGAAGRCTAFHDHLGTLLGIEVARHWRPTAVNWFDRVPKTQCLAALSEVGACELAERYAKAKKAELAEACEKLFAGEAIVEPEVKAAALAWVPAPMRFAASASDDRSLPWAESDGDGAVDDSGESEAAGALMPGDEGTDGEEEGAVPAGEEGCLVEEEILIEGEPEVVIEVAEAIEEAGTSDAAEPLDRAA
jgi:ParB family transcriptional regulator, chromosome partitioning protein